MNSLLVVWLTHLVAAAPQVSSAPGGRWVVGVGGWAFVLDEQGRRSPLDGPLHECLGEGVVEGVTTLVGDRGVVVATPVSTCAVTREGVIGVTGEFLPFHWPEYALAVKTAQEKAYAARLERSPLRPQLELAARARQRRWGAGDAVSLPGCACALAVRASGVVVLRDGGVDDATTTRLEQRLGPQDGDLALAPIDGGVRLTRTFDTGGGACPVGESLVDEVDLRWEPRGEVSAGALPRREKDVHASSHRRIALDFAALRADGGVVDVPNSELSVAADFTVLRGRRTDHLNTRALRTLISQRCVDWPTFVVEDAVLISRDDFDHVSRCGGEVRGCLLAVRFEPSKGLLTEAKTPETETCHETVARLLAAGEDARPQARWCVAQAPGSGPAELDLANALAAQQEVALARVHLELALACGLPAKERADARRRLVAP
ncbi:MAG: hypothetical protein ACOZQL_08145 [Myxococcota bacterium]